MRPNGKNDKSVELENPGHELPAAEDDGFVESQAGASENQSRPVADELTRLRAERDALLERLARQQAEFENVRKRTAKEQQDFRDYALTDAVKAMLPILDSMERALAHKDNAREFQSGVELIHKQLQDSLAKLGVQPLHAKGHPFDPHVHEAVEMVDTDRAKDHHVLDELQRGYKLKDRLLRPAMVRVARNPKK
ncbi:MAG: nucleotide exchange factor GrpE [Candidatus Koribacter versatilis]|uniref:Protein GrpE n=1 Tax=Candidatus Korobacter versatilis TaxID=658062 RepID=A0A932A893_9BACT|nr:nucleotide exchange factor GrpE [Candidatus Koribacter versatilis]